jgi:hypothetical protein
MVFNLTFKENGSSVNNFESSPTTDYFSPNFLAADIDTILFS